MTKTQSNFTSKLDRLKNAFDINSEDQPELAALAEAFFDAGVREGLQQANEVRPVLLSTEPQKALPSFPDQPEFNFPPLADVDFAHYLGQPNFLFINDEEPAELSQSQIQVVNEVLRNILDAFHEHRVDLKRATKYYWNHCLPDDDETSDNFRQLNKYKDADRELKKKYKQLADIQRILKKMKAQAL